jgi:hypothetical protein
MESTRELREEKIVEEAEAVLSNDHFINNAAQIVNQVKAKHGIDVDLKLVRRVFRTDLDLRFKKMKRVAF